MEQTIEEIDQISAEPAVLDDLADLDDPRLHARPMVVERRGDDLILCLFGALSMNVSEEAARLAIDEIGEGIAIVTVDLAGVHLIDSTGVRALVQIHRRVDEVGGRMLITRPHKTARRMLTLVHLDTVIPIGPVYEPKTGDLFAPLPEADVPAPS